MVCLRVGIQVSGQLEASLHGAPCDVHYFKQAQQTHL